MEVIKLSKQYNEKVVEESPRQTRKRLDLLNTLFIIVIPIIGLVASFFTPLQRKTAIFAVMYYFTTGLGITAGSHRLWSHRSYNASLPLRIFLALASAGAVQGSIKFWARGHRVHHRYIDTEKDPYSIKEGVFHAHLGWMLFRPSGNSGKRVKVNTSDLDADPIVSLQHKHYVTLAVLMAFALPATIAGLGWGDWQGGLVYAGMIRMMAVQQSAGPFSRISD
jgi:stearoyl-CoA desaturase (delta-9 desaturase)